MIEVLLALLIAQAGPDTTNGPTAPPTPTAAPAPVAAPAPAPKTEQIPTVTLTLSSRPADQSAPTLLASTAEALARPAEVRLAEPLTLEMTIVSDVGAEVFPPLLPALGGFEIVSPDKGLERVEAQKKTTTRRWTVLPVRVGVEKVTTIEVPYRTLDGAEGVVTTPALRVYVRGHLENDNDPALGAAPPLADVIATNWVLIWILSIGGTLIFAAIVGWIVVLAMRQRFEALKPKAPPRPANEVAMERLARLDATPDHELDGGRRVAETIDTLREYLGRRYDIDALEMTTNELATALTRGLDLRGASPEGIVSLLQSADLVKFARLVPPPDEARAPAAIVRQLVEQTWVETQPENETETRTRAEPASIRQRLFGGLVDLVLSGLLGLLGLLGLVLAGLPELGWIPLGAIGLLMLIRDAFGPSPGKRLLRTVVVVRDLEQSTPGPRRLLVRNVLLVLWPLLVPIEWFILRSHPLSLRLGDMWADTEVVRDMGTKGGRS